MESQGYAELAEHSYDRKGEMRDLVNKEVTLEGVAYKVLAYVDNPASGYQGTIYQRVDTSEIIVAHRGTEFERERWNDLVRTDGAMVLGRVNPQAADAIALTRRALEIAMKEGALEGRTPEVTVTGHSLGGTLAQITAHHYNLRGETFNAYGAASLHYRIPEGGDRVINHVTAADLVSSASPHYGQVRVYAMPQEIEMLQRHGYANTDSRMFDVRNKLGAAAAGLGSHDMHCFRNRDGDDRPDRSVLLDPRARELAREYAPMIGKFRADVEEMRSGLAIGVRGAPGALLDTVHRLRGPLEPGEPAAREERERARRDNPQSHAVPGGISSYRAVPDLLEGSQLYRTLYGDASRVAVPLRPSETESQGPARLSAGSEAANRERAQSVFVNRLLAAAAGNDPDAVGREVQAMWNAEPGQRWRAQVDGHRQELEAADRARDGQVQQREAQPAGLGY
jgi:hypothetical protein